MNEVRNCGTACATIEIEGMLRLVDTVKMTHGHGPTCFRSTSGDLAVLHDDFDKVEKNQNCRGTVTTIS